MLQRRKPPIFEIHSIEHYIYNKILLFPDKRSLQNFRGIRGEDMEHTDENIMDPFNIGLYLIEAGLVGVVIYAMMVLPDLFQSMT